MGTGQVIYLYQDALGSTRTLVNQYGAVTGRYDYKAFGSLLSSSGTSTQFRFTGQQVDDETDLYYLRARYYDPTTGRFMTVDPLPAINPYIYADNCPTVSVDPSGQGSYRMPH